MRERGKKRGEEGRGGTKERKVRGKVDEGRELLLPLTGGREGSLGELH